MMLHSITMAHISTDTAVVCSRATTRLKGAMLMSRHLPKPNKANVRHVCVQAASLGPMPRLARTVGISDTKLASNQAPPARKHTAKPLHELSFDADEDYLLPQWAEQYIRQVPALPNGCRAMLQLLTAVEDMKVRAQSRCGPQSAAVKAYLLLALIDIMSHAWLHRMQELDEALAGNVSNEVFSQQHLEARLALCGCRYLRIHAANEFAKQIHTLMDGEGYYLNLDLLAVPQPHTLGLNFAQLLQQGLGIDPQSPVIRAPSAEEIHDMQLLPFEAYHVMASDMSICGDWEYCYWGNQASLVPAPHAKFSTKQLAGLLTADVVLASLRNGIWGRAMVAAASEVGAPVDFAGLAGGEQQVAVMAGAGSVGSASAWLFLQSQLASHKGVFAKVTQLAVAAMAAVVTVVQQHHQQHTA